MQTKGTPASIVAVATYPSDPSPPAMPIMSAPSAMASETSSVRSSPRSSTRTSIPLSLAIVAMSASAALPPPDFGLTKSTGETAEMERTTGEGRRSAYAPRKLITAMITTTPTKAQGDVQPSQSSAATATMAPPAAAANQTTRTVPIALMPKYTAKTTTTRPNQETSRSGRFCTRRTIAMTPRMTKSTKVTTAAALWEACGSAGRFMAAG